MPLNILIQYKPIVCRREECNFWREAWFHPFRDISYRLEWSSYQPLENLCAFQSKHHPCLWYPPLLTYKALRYLSTKLWQMKCRNTWCPSHQLWSTLWNSRIEKIVSQCSARLIRIGAWIHIFEPSSTDWEKRDNSAASTTQNNQLRLYILYHGRLYDYLYKNKTSFKTQPPGQ